MLILALQINQARFFLHIKHMYIFFGSVDLTTLLTVHIHLICKKGIFFISNTYGIVGNGVIVVFVFALLFGKSIKK